MFWHRSHIVCYSITDCLSHLSVREYAWLCSTMVNNLWNLDSRLPFAVELQCGMVRTQSDIPPCLNLWRTGEGLENPT